VVDDITVLLLDRTILVHRNSTGGSVASEGSSK
jgi:hypothetical protein